MIIESGTGKKLTPLQAAKIVYVHFGESWNPIGIFDCDYAVETHRLTAREGWLIEKHLEKIGARVRRYLKV